LSPLVASDSAVGVPAALTYVAPGFFDVVDAPIIVGRDFTAADSTLEVPPLILSDSLARHLFPSGAVGQRVRAAILPDERLIELDVVGVARAGHGGGFREYESDLPLAFAPIRAARSVRGMLYIRTNGPAEPLLPLVRAAVHQEAPTFPVTRLSTLASSDADRRNELKKIGGAGLGAGGVAMLLAAIGLYAMLSVAVGQRRREIGVRLAIGARRSQVVGLFFMRGMKTALLGLAVGLPLSIIALRLITTQLEISSSQIPVVALVIASALVVVASLASWLPARRAATVDPSSVLRSE
jgi:hypothetical protein